MLSAEELADLDKFYRYVDRDDDAITYRTLPGVNPKGAYFTVARATTSGVRTPRTPPNIRSSSTA